MKQKINLFIKSKIKENMQDTHLYRNCISYDSNIEGNNHLIEPRFVHQDTETKAVYERPLNGENLLILEHMIPEGGELNGIRPK